MEQVGEVGGGLVMEGFLGEKKDFKLDPLCYREPVEVLEGVMWSREREWVSRKAASSGYSFFRTLNDVP